MRFIDNEEVIHTLQLRALGGHLAVVLAGNSSIEEHNLPAVATQAAGDLNAVAGQSGRQNIGVVVIPTMP